MLQHQERELRTGQAQTVVPRCTHKQGQEWSVQAPHLQPPSAERQQQQHRHQYSTSRAYLPAFVRRMPQKRRLRMPALLALSTSGPTERSWTNRRLQQEAPRRQHLQRQHVLHLGVVLVICLAVQQQPQQLQHVQQRQFLQTQALPLPWQQ